MLLSREEASFCAVVDGDGEVTDFLRLPHIMKRRNGWNRDDADLKVNNVNIRCHGDFNLVLRLL